MEQLPPQDARERYYTSLGLWKEKKAALDGVWTLLWTIHGGAVVVDPYLNLCTVVLSETRPFVNRNSRRRHLFHSCSIAYENLGSSKSLAVSVVPSFAW